MSGNLVRKNKCFEEFDVEELKQNLENDFTNQLNTGLANKQDKLTAGENITIKDNVISATVPSRDYTKIYSDSTLVEKTATFSESYKNFLEIMLVAKSSTSWYSTMLIPTALIDNVKTFSLICQSHLGTTAQITFDSETSATCGCNNSESTTNLTYIVEIYGINRIKEVTQ